MPKIYGKEANIGMAGNSTYLETNIKWMLKKIIKGIGFLLVGIALFWYVYRDIDINSIKETLIELKYGWIFLSFALGLASHFIRAIRWGILIKSLDYQPRKANLFLSILILYFINLAIPRGGEVARCGVINRYEKIPLTKLIGTVFIERFTDFVAFLLIFAVVIVWQFNNAISLFATFELDFSGLQSKLILLGITLIIGLLFFFLSKKFGLITKFSHKLKQIKTDVLEGIKSISKIKNKSLYFIYTFLIFIFWLLMTYVVFFAYTPTNDLGLSAAIFAYTIGTLAYLLPIQAGLGVWHFLAIQSLFLFGLDKESGLIFALIAHTFTNVVYLIFGAMGFIILPWINLNEK